MKKIIIFTDLDGTLLDYSTYSFEQAFPALKLLKQKEIPLVICSSKSRKEIEYYRKKLDNNYPFISENGGGIFIPKDFLTFKFQDTTLKFNEEKDYYVITLSVSYSELRKAIKSLRKEGFDVRGFGDMSEKEVAHIAGLSIEEAVMAKERDFDEPFIFNGDEQNLNALLASIKSKGLNFTRSRFFHILGRSDKGKAVEILIELYKRKFGDILTLALGNSTNDIPMLKKVNQAIIVKKPDGEYDPQIIIPKIIKADGIGPEGWNAAVFSILSEYS